MTQQIAIRVDASVEIGSGHVMRCLTLARALQAQGCNVLFVSRVQPGNLNAHIRQQGFAVAELPAPRIADAGLSPAPHAAWLGVDWHQDARQTVAALRDRTFDWLIMDHYALDAAWQEAVVPAGCRLMVIDDLADRPHRADLLLDQNLGRAAEDYAALVPPNCTILVGPQYAILRPEFAMRRAEALARRMAPPALRTILVFMGGMDKDNATGAVLTALAGCALPDDVQVCVVMGSRSPTLEAVRAQCEGLPFQVELRVDAADMAELMSRADLAIGAAGSTSWERCCLGLPTIILALAENQIGIAQYLVGSGLASSPGPISARGFEQRLRECLATLSDSRHRLAMSSIATDICDGDGVARLLNRLLPQDVCFRNAHAADSRRIWEWRRASNTAYKVAATDPDFLQHHRWFLGALASSDRIIRVMLKGQLEGGYSRLDLRDKASARISICLSPEQRGQGAGRLLIDEAIRKAREVGVGRIDADVHRDNMASASLFSAAGFKKQDEDSIFHTYVLSLGEDS